MFDERVVGRDGAVEVEPQDLAVDVVQRLAVADRGDVVAHAPPQLAVRADLQVVAGVVQVLQTDCPGNRSSRWPGDGAARRR